MLTSQYFSGDGHPAEEVPAGQIDQRLKDGTGGVLWLDLRDATEQDFQMLSAEFGFHPLAMEDLRQSDQRPRIVEYGDYIFLVAHEWQPSPEREDLTKACAERRTEINAFVGPNYIVTIHAGDSQVLDTTRKRWEGNREMQRQGPYFLLYLLLDSLVDDYYPSIDAFDDRIDTLEHLVLMPVSEQEEGGMPQTLRSGDQKPLTTLLGLRRDLLELRRNVAPLRDAVNVLLRRVEALQDEGQRETVRSDRARALYAYFQDVYDHCIRIVDTIDTFRDLLSGTLDAHLAVASNRLNEIVKVLTSVSIILMSWATISGIYGMNFTDMPELHWRYGYPYALALMVVTAVAEGVYLRRRGWI